MISFVLRSIIMFMGVGITASYTGMHGISLFGAIIFLCLWISVKKMELIFGWVVTFSVFCALIQFDREIVSCAIMIASIYTYDMIRRYLVRSNNASRVWFFCVAILIACVGWGISVIDVPHVFLSSGYPVLVSIIGSVGIFYCGDYVIRRMEHVIDLYAHGGDLRIHT